MQRFLTAGLIVLVNGTVMAGCATRAQLRRATTAQQAALESERSERVAADQQINDQLASVTSDVAQLRQDLEGLRTEFGAQITALKGNLEFAMPIHFQFDKAEIENEAYPALDRFASVVQNYYQGSQVTVEGFADPAGSAAYNKQLSERRAQAVQAYLVSRGLPENGVHAVGYGEDRLVVPGAANADTGAELNRRVVFVIEGGAAALSPTPTTPPTTGPGAT